MHVNSCNILYTTRERVSVLNVFQLRNLPRVQIGGDALEMFSYFFFLHIVRNREEREQNAERSRHLSVEKMIGLLCHTHLPQRAFYLRRIKAAIHVGFQRC